MVLSFCRLRMSRLGAAAATRSVACLAHAAPARGSLAFARRPQPAPALPWRGDTARYRIRPLLLPQRGLGLSMCTNASDGAKKPGKLRQLVREYGALGVAVYIGVYLTTLGSLFAAVETNILPAGDALNMLRRIGADRLFDLDKINPSAGNFAVAWILAKFTEPFRMLTTLAILPRIGRLVKRFRGIP